MTTPSDNNILKTILLPIILVFLLGNNSFAQHLEWGATASHISLSYEYSSLGPDNNIVVGGTTNNHYSQKISKAELFDSEGESHQFRDSYYPRAFGGDGNIVISYSSEGLINWQYLLMAGYSELQGITHDESGNTVLLLRANEVYDFNYENRRCKIPRIDRSKNTTPGLYLIYLDKNGKYIKRKKILTDTTPYNIFLGQFSAHPNGGFIITGRSSSGKLFEESDLVMENGGGHFILQLDKSGNLFWADTITFKNSSKNKKRYGSQLCKAAIAKDGTIYVGGSFREEGNFDGAPIAETYEVYVVAYSPQNQKKWIQTSKSKSMFHSITANQNGVYIGFNLFGSNTFNHTVDTFGTQTMVLAHFDKTGILQWINTSDTYHSYAMKMDAENNLYILGLFRNISNRIGKKYAGVIGTDTIKNSFTIFIASYDELGNYRWVKGTKLLVMGGYHIHNLLMDDCNNMYITGGVFFPNKRKMNIFNDAFLKGEIDGKGPFISKFNNTIPKKVVKNLMKNEVCIISPGPWKVRNYPNPFESTTRFEYTLSYPDEATLSVYDLKGELIHNAFSRRLHEKGTHEFIFNAILPAGTYVVVLKGSETSATCKIVVINK